MGTGHRAFVRKRTGWLFIILLVAYLGLAARLVVVQVARTDEYTAWADEIRYREDRIPAMRGSIRDRHGRDLVVSLETSSIFVNRNEVGDVALAARRIARVLHDDPRRIEGKIHRSTDSIVWLRLQMDPRSASDLIAGGGRIPGLGVQPDTKRVYPSGPLAAHILGFTNMQDEGVEGLECRLNSILTGRDGLLRGEVDAQRCMIPQTRHLVRVPRHGRNVYLTIDASIQNIAEQALARMANTHRPQSACAIVLDAKTSQVLALANYPSYDPNRARSYPASRWRNWAVADLYEPGSTLKVVTVAASLNEGIDPRQIVGSCNGSMQIRGGRIRCSLHHPFMSGHGAVDMYKIIRHSCNIGAASLAFRLGPDRLYAYEKAFGLLDRTDCGFGCEAVGKMLPAQAWRPMKLANVGFGQGIAVTPLQMACVYATIANGGVYVQPTIIREIRSADGTIVQRVKPGVRRRVISEAAAGELTRMLASCVEEGTGKNARIKGRTVCGKTGSAQIPLPRGGYESDAFVASFMGFAPAYKPKLVIAVVVKRPKGSHFGATVAAPVFREIGEKSLWYLKVPPDAPADDENPRQDGDRKSLV